ncbi:hypothetical protein U875_10590 [Pandoraea pnomenusa 3kgm]|nr:hypothetical protein U875_10590 [Pandoraea pnomenusa 3kgm]
MPLQEIDPTARKPRDGRRAGPLRQRCELLRQRECPLARHAFRHQPVHQPDLERLLRAHGAACEDHVERAAHADQPRQTYGAAVDERYPETAAKDPECRGIVRDTQIAPQGQLEAARHGMAADRGNHGFVEVATREAHRAVATAIGRHHIAPLGVVERREIGAGAERCALAAQHRDARIGVLLKCDQRVAQGGRHRAVHRVAPRRAREGNDRHRPVCLQFHALGGWR